MHRPLAGLLIASFLLLGLAGCGSFMRSRPRTHRLLLTLSRVFLLSQGMSLCLLRHRDSSQFSDDTNGAVLTCEAYVVRDRGQIEGVIIADVVRSDEEYGPEINKTWHSFTQTSGYLRLKLETLYKPLWRRVQGKLITSLKLPFHLFQ